MPKAKHQQGNRKHKHANGVKRVALILESDMAFDRAIARGVGDFIHSHSGWIVLMDPMTKPSIEKLQHWAPDAILASVQSPAINELSTLKDIPIVGFGSYPEKNNAHLKFPMVTSNQREIGRMGARYFINKGLKRFAFCGGMEEADWCCQRKEGFVEELKMNGYECAVYEPQLEHSANMPESIHSLGNWMESLPKPTGILVFFDGWARWVLDACVMFHLQVPQEVSVIGVDNDRWLCELAQPALSSINPNVRTCGYVASEILKRIMDGETDVPQLTMIDPVRVVERDSSNYLSIDDVQVAFAVRYIKEHACDPITPNDVLNVTGMSNSTAYRKFMKAIGRSMHSEIQRIQLDRVKELLVSTNLNVTSVARQAGFENIRYLTKVFRDATGLTPTEYRRQHSTPQLLSR